MVCPEKFINRYAMLLSKQIPERNINVVIRHFIAYAFSAVCLLELFNIVRILSDQLFFPSCKMFVYMRRVKKPAHTVSFIPLIIKNTDQHHWIIKRRISAGYNIRSDSFQFLYFNICYFCHNFSPFHSKPQTDSYTFMQCLRVHAASRQSRPASYHPKNRIA